MENNCWRSCCQILSFDFYQRHLLTIWSKKKGKNLVLIKMITKKFFLSLYRSRHEDHSLHRSSTMWTIRSRPWGEEFTHSPPCWCLAWWLWRHGTIETRFERRCDHAFDGAKQRSRCLGSCHVSCRLNVQTKKLFGAKLFFLCFIILGLI